MKVMPAEIFIRVLENIEFSVEALYLNPNSTCKNELNHIRQVVRGYINNVDDFCYELDTVEMTEKESYEQHN
jgi:hypothetical protein